MYVGGLGCKGLVECLHPPLDNGLVKGLRTAVKERGVTVKGGVLHKWKGIIHIRRSGQYFELIEKLRGLAPKLGCRTAFELERFWKG